MKKLIFLFLFLLILIPLVAAVKPSGTAIVVESGVDINFPMISPLKQNETYSFHFHATNSSNGAFLTNSTLTCSFHLYNSTGNHIVEVNHEVAMESNNIDWEAKVLGVNFSNVGQYSYLFDCNSTSSNIGGSVEDRFTVTESGNSINEGNATTIYTIVLFFMIIASLFFYSFFKSDGKFQVKWVFFVVGYIFFLSALSLSILSLRDSLVNPSIISFLDSFMAISFLLFWFAFGLLLVMWFLTALQTILFNKKKGDLEKYGSS